MFDDSVETWLERGFNMQEAAALATLSMFEVGDLLDLGYGPNPENLDGPEIFSFDNAWSNVKTLLDNTFDIDTLSGVVAEVFVPSEEGVKGWLWLNTAEENRPQSEGGRAIVRAGREWVSSILFGTDGLDGPNNNNGLATYEQDPAHKVINSKTGAIEVGPGKPAKQKTTIVWKDFNK
jgi:hypothetical protein